MAVTYIDNDGTWYRYQDGVTSQYWYVLMSAVSSSADGLDKLKNYGIMKCGTITGATKTKITYDSYGFVTAGADATTADIADSTNKRYVTDAQLTVIGNTSGTNTGDQTITLTGHVTGSGTGSFATTIAAGVVTNAMLAGSIASSKLVGTDITTVGALDTGTIKTTVKFVDLTDTTKALAFNLAGMTTGKTLTISSTQSTNQTLSIPNITGADTVMVLGLNQTVTGTLTLTTPVLGVATATSVAATGALTSSGTAGIGYATGAGGTVTQATNKTTGVTLNKICGAITTTNAALAAGAEAKFTVTNSTVAATDVVAVCIKSGGTSGSYAVVVSAVAAGSFDITITNLSGGSLSEALVINFVVIKAVAA